MRKRFTFSLLIFIFGFFCVTLIFKTKSFETRELIQITSPHDSLIGEKLRSKNTGLFARSQKIPYKHEPTDALVSNSDELTENIEELVASLPVEEQVASIQTASEIFEAIRAELGSIETIQGQLVIQIENDEPILSGAFYVSRKDRGQPRPLPWRYAVRISDPRKGWNLLTSDSQGEEPPQIWFAGNEAGTRNENSLLPEMLTLQLPNLVTGPILSVCGAYNASQVTPLAQKNAKTLFFYHNVVHTHRTTPQEQKGLDDSPFWILDTLDSKYWISEKKQLRRFSRTPRAGSKLDIAYDKYNVINGIQYPMEITVHMKAGNDPRGMHMIEAFTGKQNPEARIKVLLSKISINETIAESKFERED